MPFHFPKPYLNPIWKVETIWQPRTRCSMLMSNHLIGFGAGGGGFTDPVAIWAVTMAANGSGFADYSIRVVVDDITAGGTQVRATLTANSGSTTQIDNLGIGVRTTTADTAATPVELLVSGASGVTMSAGATALTDWATLTFADTARLVCIADMASSNGNTRRTSVSNADLYYKSATNSYNSTSSSGFTEFLGDQSHIFSKLEARSAS